MNLIYIRSLLSEFVFSRAGVISIFFSRVVSVVELISLSGFRHVIKDVFSDWLPAAFRINILNILQ